MPGAFRGILKTQPSTLGLVGSLPGPAQAVRLGLGCSNQIFIIFDQKKKNQVILLIPAEVEVGEGRQ